MARANAFAPPLAAPAPVGPVPSQEVDRRPPARSHRPVPLAQGKAAPPMPSVHRRPTPRPPTTVGRRRPRRRDCRRPIEQSAAEGDRQVELGHESPPDARVDDHPSFGARTDPATPSTAARVTARDEPAHGRRPPRWTSGPGCGGVPARRHTRPLRSPWRASGQRHPHDGPNASGSWPHRQPGRGHRCRPPPSRPAGGRPRPGDHDARACSDPVALEEC